MAETSPRPLYVGTEPACLDEVLRIAAAVGAEVEVVPDAGAARRRWLEPPLVIVGGDAAEEASLVGLPRRDDVVLVAVDLDDAEVWRRAVGVGASQVVFLPDSEAWLARRVADAVEGGGRRGATVAVVGGRGGAGATTLAVALAVTGVRTGRRTMLVDGDPLGGGIDLALGGEDAAGLRWPDLVGATGRVGSASLHDALPAVGELSVLSWDRGDALRVPAGAMGSLLDAGARGSDLVVVDLPRGVDDATAVALGAADVALLVVPAEVRAAAAAARVATGVALHCADVRLVVREPAPAGLSGAAVAEALGLPLAGQLRPEPGLARALERGEPPGRRGRGPLAAFAEGFLAEVAPLRRAAA